MYLVLQLSGFRCPGFRKMGQPRYFFAMRARPELMLVLVALALRGRQFPQRLNTLQRPHASQMALVPRQLFGPPRGPPLLINGPLQLPLPPGAAWAPPPPLAPIGAAPAPPAPLTPAAAAARAPWTNERAGKGAVEQTLQMVIGPRPARWPSIFMFLKAMKSCRGPCFKTKKKNRNFMTNNLGCCGR